MHACMKDLPNRSDKYQYRILEVLLQPTTWDMFTESQDRAFPLTDERIVFLQDLDEQLHHHLQTMIDTDITARQKQILLMYASGMTQMEIASELDVNQSSVTKSLNGNTDYSKGHKVYGGLKNKFVKLIRNNMEIRPIMKQIHEHWEPGSLRLPFYQTFRNILGNETEFMRWLNYDPECFKSPVRVGGGLTRLTDEDILQIRSERKAGASLKTLGVKFHISTYRLKALLEK